MTKEFQDEMIRSVYEENKDEIEEYKRMLGQITDDIKNLEDLLSSFPISSFSYDISEDLSLEFFNSSIHVTDGDNPAKRLLGARKEMRVKMYPHLPMMLRAALDKCVNVKKGNDSCF